MQDFLFRTRNLNSRRDEPRDDVREVTKAWFCVAFFLALVLVVWVTVSVDTTHEDPNHNSFWSLDVATRVKISQEVEATRQEILSTIKERGAALTADEFIAMRMSLIEYHRLGALMGPGVIVEMDQAARELPQYEELVNGFIAYTDALEPKRDHSINWAASAWSAAIFYLAFMLATLRGFVLRIRERHKRDFTQAFAEDWQLFIPFLTMWPLGLFCYVGDGREAAFLRQRAENRCEMAMENGQMYSDFFATVWKFLRHTVRGPQLQKAFVCTFVFFLLVVLTPAITTFAEDLTDPTKDQFVSFYTDSGDGEDSWNLRYNKKWNKSGWVVAASMPLAHQIRTCQAGFGRDAPLFKFALEPRLMTSWDYTSGDWKLTGIDPEFSFASDWPVKYGDLFSFNQFNWKVMRPDDRLDYAGWFTDTAIRWGAGKWWAGPHLVGYVPETGHHSLSIGPSFKLKATKRWSITVSYLKDLFYDPTGDYKIIIGNFWKPKFINRY